ncbi:MAG: hypothetical protein CR982_04560 [Candidatus Cloacimonadota bacterium]|nr:MAG: hypothetical protein CR982_04560 [Candidatus Cloacimonadota bacterium]PIE78934.1 MAG: hypothetical protein CSA15_05325 [Candidatus Delongbacteria bacterium]
MKESKEPVLPKIFISLGVIVPIFSIFIMEKDPEAPIIPLSRCLQEINGTCITKITMFDSLTFSAILVLLGFWLSFSSKKIISKDDVLNKESNQDYERK